MLEFIPMIATVLSATVLAYSIASAINARKKQKEKSLHYLSHLMALSNQWSGANRNIKASILEIQNILDLICEGMSFTTHKQIYAAIKVFKHENTQHDLQIVTMIRDSNSSSERELLQYQYSIKSNPPYESLIAPPIFKKRMSYYLNNDVKRASEGGYYHNASKEDESIKYRSTLIIPLYSPPQPINNSKIQFSTDIGFLCLDSMQPDAFSDESLKYALAAAPMIRDILIHQIQSNSIRAEDQ